MEDVPGLGYTGDLVKVSPGYARNYLLPRNLAAPATDATRKRVEKRKVEADIRRAQHREAAQGALDIDGLRRQQGGAAGILDRPLHLVAGELAQVGQGIGVVPDHAAKRHQHQHKPYQYHLQQGAWANLGHRLFSCVLTGAPA